MHAHRHRTRDILEFTSSPAGLRVDREQGVIYGVKVLGRKSGNGPIYPQPVTRRALPMYEGAKVNLDHPPRTRPTDDRSVQDRFGKLQNVRDQTDGLYADLHYIRSHPMADVVAEAAESMPDVFGLSHNANIRESLDTGEVVAINRVRSVDLVADPGTTRGIFESQEKRMDPTNRLVADPPESAASSGALQSAADIQGALSDGIAEILAGQGDATSKAEAIACLARELLGVAEDQEDAGDSSDEGTMDAHEDEDSAMDEEGDQTEGLQSPSEWNARLKLLESRERAREILESAGIAPHALPAVNQARVAALVAVLDDPTQCEALVSTWKTASSPAVKPRSTAANVLESRKSQPDSSTGFNPRTIEQMKREAALAFGR
jgi:hypothetical protein